MGYEEDLEVYRSQLLQSLSNQPSRLARGQADPIQVYVNERRVGELEGVGAGATLHVQSLDHIETIQLRTEDGTLLGGLVAPDYGYRTSRIRLSSDAVELCVHNTAQGGSLNAVFVPAPSYWTRTWKALAGVADRLAIQRPDAAIARSMRTVAFTQALLAVMVVGLVVDRMTAWMSPEQVPVSVVQPEALRTVSVTEMEKLEQQLGELARMQEKVGAALESQHKGMAQLHQTMAQLSSSHESVASSVVMVKEEMVKRQEGSETDRPTQRSVSDFVQKEQLEAAIKSLTVDNARLSNELARLEERTQTLSAKLQAAAVTASKAVDQNPERLLASQADVASKNQSVQVAESRQNSQTQPFLFWVTFSEGTSQERIDQWVHEKKGHKGAVNEGWQEVRIVPPAVPPDLFLEQIRGEKIVKAARIGE
jgi:predicted  nucleic acid-binding Zn-ribbon protein